MEISLPSGILKRQFLTQQQNLLVEDVEKVLGKQHSEKLRKRLKREPEECAASLWHKLYTPVSGSFSHENTYVFKVIRLPHWKSRITAYINKK